MTINVVFPWTNDIYIRLVWLPVILIIASVTMLILYLIMKRTIRLEKIVIISNALGYAAISLLFSIAFYWYFFLIIMWISRLPLNKIIEDTFNEVIAENNNDNKEQLPDENGKQEPLINEMVINSESWKFSIFEKRIRLFEIFTFYFPVVIIVIYILSGIGYRL